MTKAAIVMNPFIAVMDGAEFYGVVPPQRLDEAGSGRVRKIESRYAALECRQAPDVSVSENIP